MGDYRYTDCPIKLPPLFRAPAVCVVPVWLICRLMRSDVIHMRFLSKYYNKNTFNTFQLSVPVAVNITWDNYATCVLLYSRFYKHKFLQLPHQLMAGLYIWSPTLWHAVYHRPAVYILCRGHGVIIYSNQYKIGKNQ